jgi:hypothetical protein
MAAGTSGPDVTVIWEPHPAQAAFISCPVFEILYGGARGGGKTDAVLGDWLEHADAYGEHAIGLMVRRTRTELVETIERSKVLYSPLGWTFQESEKMWRATNGARLRFAYLERDADAQVYMGHSYTRVYVEEITNFPDPAPILKLMATLRSGAGVPTGFRATGNPGGPGHQWVKSRYVDPAPLGWRVFTDPLTGLERVFIPAKVTDNPSLGDEYVSRLQASGSAELVRAWLEGDWSVVQGAFFDCWSNDKHVIRPFEIPADWLRFRSMDWGSASPFSVGWWAVAGDDYPIGEGLADGGVEGRGRRVIPRGALVRYREWYGSREVNELSRFKGLKLTTEEIGKGILEREARGEKIKYSVLDPSAFANNGGPSHAERLAVMGLHFHLADNKRQSIVGAMGGWDMMRARLVGIDGVPMIYCFSTCVDSIRTIPALQHDEKKPEDVDTNMEDHAGDEWRYACMSRPWVPKKDVAPTPKYDFMADEHGVIKSTHSIRELIERQARRRRGL